VGIEQDNTKMDPIKNTIQVCAVIHTVQDREMCTSGGNVMALWVP
jgi:hypothetical protein